MEASPKLKDGRMAPPSRLAAGRMRRRIVAAAVRGSGLAALSSLALLWAHLLHQMPSMDGHYNHRSASEGPWNRHRALNEARLSETPVASEFDKCGSIVNDQEDQCSYVRENCLDDGEGILNFTYFHFCTMAGRSSLSFVCLSALVLLAFYLLGETAEEYFCPVVKKLTEVLDLAPNTAGVTFLAFGNGAPDVFSSLAAFLEGDGKIGLGAIVSGGGFVCAFVVGAVAIASAPFAVYDGPLPLVGAGLVAATDSSLVTAARLDTLSSQFKVPGIGRVGRYTRDVCFYFVAALLVFLIFCNGHIHAWEALGLVAYYCVFVIYVVWNDKAKGKASSGSQGSAGGISPSPRSSRVLGSAKTAPKPQAAHSGGSPMESASLLPAQRNRSARQQANAEVVETAALQIVVPIDHAVNESPSPGPDGLEKMGSLTLIGALKAHAEAWWDEMRELSFPERLFTVAMQPFTFIRRATIPDVNTYDKLHATTNTLMCPLLILLFFNDFVEFGMPVGVFGEGSVPLWSLVLLQSFFLAMAQWYMTDWVSLPVWMERIYLSLSFVCSIAWISIFAQELLSCLSTLGHVMGLSPAIMGVTVLAWGNSVGDLVADVALAKTGQPVVALAGCYAGPLFNMLVGLGLALIIKTVMMYPQPYGLHYNANVPVSFGFLFVALISSMIVVPFSDYRITKAWGCCLVLLYFTAMLTSLLIESKILDL